MQWTVRFVCNHRRVRLFLFGALAVLLVLAEAGAVASALAQSPSPAH